MAISRWIVFRPWNLPDLVVDISFVLSDVRQSVAAFRYLFQYLVSEHVAKLLHSPEQLHDAAMLYELLTDGVVAFDRARLLADFVVQALKDFG